jgi:pyruvate,orthophosphate dikinase
VDRVEAVRRCRAYLEKPPTIDSTADPATGAVIAEGQPAAPGRAVGMLCLDLDAAVELHAEGRDVILVRRETSPADIHGMAASIGFVTTLGGPVSHAAIVARSWGLPAVVGASGLTILDGAVRGPGGDVEEGEIVTVDGDAGRLLRGAHPGQRTIAPEVAVIRRWADDVDGHGDARA